MRYRTVRPAIHWGGLILFLFLLASCKASPVPTEQPNASQVQSTCSARLQIDSTPQGASVSIDGAYVGQTPGEYEISAGTHAILVVRDGFASSGGVVSLECNQVLNWQTALDDVTPPEVHLAELPNAVQPQQGLKVIAHAEDNWAIETMTLELDGEMIYQVDEATLRYNVDTQAIAAGDHVLTVMAIDRGGNRSSVNHRFSLDVPTEVPSPTSQPTATPTARPVASPTSIPPSPSPSPTISPTPKPTVSVRWETRTIQTYAYEQALYTDSAHAGHPYPLLKWEQVGAPEPKTYSVLALRNEFIELLLVPDLGGRIYQLRLRDTGQTLLYNNQVIKPTRWGPPDQGWWLAVGGIEFCAPIDEHGYLTALPWEASWSQGDDGSVTVAMRTKEQTRQLDIVVSITLAPKSTSFVLQPAIRNSGQATGEFQFWINAMLAPGGASAGPELRFYYPTQRMIVHSTGDPSLPSAGSEIPWPIFQGRDLSRYGNWANWLGLFAVDMEQPFMAVYDTERDLGLVRCYPPETTRGAKLFGFGRDFDTTTYTDDETQYVEMWGGLTRTFWEWTSLAPGAELSWREVWYPIRGLSGLLAATPSIALNGQRVGADIFLELISPRLAQWTVLVYQSEEILGRQTLHTSPGTPAQLSLPGIVRNPGLPVIVHILNAQGEQVLVQEF